jgi:general secretion pathway protein K
MSLKLRIPYYAFQKFRLRQGFGGQAPNRAGSGQAPNRAGLGPAPNHAGSGQAKGVALIMVLWVMTILSVVVLEFSFAMRTEVNITQNYKEDLQLYSMAQGGIQRAIAELIYKHDPKVQLLRKTLVTEEIPADKMEWVADGRVYTFPFDQGRCEIKMMSEAGKVNINLVSESVLRRIISLFGIEGDKRDIVVDSILDWKDPDDFYRVNGAENAYYQSLKEPYDCKNANFDSIEELLLVRGVSPALFYGRKGLKNGEEGEKETQAGLKDIFSVYSPGGQIDINSATSVVLKVILGIPEDVSQKVVKAREEKAFDNQLDLLQRVPELRPFIEGDPERQSLILYGKTIITPSYTPYYAIESRARMKEGESGRGLKVIVKIDSKEKEGYKIVQWIDKL